LKKKLHINIILKLKKMLLNVVNKNLAPAQNRGDIGLGEKGKMTPLDRRLGIYGELVSLSSGEQYRYPNPKSLPHKGHGSPAHRAQGTDLTKGSLHNRRESNGGFSNMQSRGGRFATSVHGSPPTISKFDQLSTPKPKTKRVKSFCLKKQDRQQLNKKSTFCYAGYQRPISEQNSVEENSPSPKHGSP
jgi:hypothetical protein